MTDTRDPASEGVPVSGARSGAAEFRGRSTDLDMVLGAGFVVVTFGEEDYESCPLGRCVVGAFFFNHEREAKDFVRNLDPNGIDQYPHVVPLDRISAGESGVFERQAAQLLTGQEP